MINWCLLLAMKVLFSFYRSLVFWWVFGPHSTKWLLLTCGGAFERLTLNLFVFWVVSFEPFSLIKMTFQRHTMGNQYLKLAKVWEQHSHWNWCPTTNQPYPQKKSLKKNSILVVLLFYLIFFTIKTLHVAPSKLTSHSTYNVLLVGPAYVIGQRILNLLYCKVTHPNIILVKVGLILEFLQNLLKLTSIWFLNQFYFQGS